MQAVYLLDLDNTLIDNDRARDRQAAETVQILGAELSRDYWAVYEAVREGLGYVDTLATLARFHREHPSPEWGALDRALLDFPYAEVRYPSTLDVLASLRRRGAVVVLSDGDPIFQPLKIARSGVGDAVDHNVLVFAHKDQHLDDVARLFPADHYVAVDDRAGILARIKLHWSSLVTTVHVLQGKYAVEPFDGPRPDLVITGIADLPSALGTSLSAQVLRSQG